MDDNLQKLRDQSLKMQQALQQQEVVSEIGQVKIIMRGDQYVRSVLINGQEYPQLAEVFNDAIRKTQELAARKLMEIQQG